MNIVQILVIHVICNSSLKKVTYLGWGFLGLSKGYFEATRGYVIYSPRVQPELNKYPGALK